MQRFNLENAIVLDMDIWRLKSRGAWQLDTGLLARPGGRIDRPARLRHFRRRGPHAGPSGLPDGEPHRPECVLIFELSATATRIRQHYIEVAQSTYDLIVPRRPNLWCGNRTSPVSAMEDMSGIGAEACMDAGAGLEVAHRLGYDGIVIGLSDYRVFNHTLQLTWLFPPPQTAAASF